MRIKLGEVSPQCVVGGTRHVNQYEGTLGLPRIYNDCPDDPRCGHWRKGIDVRICNRCGAEIPDTAHRNLAKQQ